MKNKKGKAPQPASIAQRVLTEVPALPGCFCTPPESISQGAQNFWAPHGDSRQNVQAVMEEQVKTLSARGKSGPAATALTIQSSMGPGLKVDLVGALDEGEELYVPGEDEVSDSDEYSDEEMEGLEGEEEEEFEGEESEEEMSDDEV